MEPTGGNDALVKVGRTEVLVGEKEKSVVEVIECTFDVGVKVLANTEVEGADTAELEVTVAILVTEPLVIAVPTAE